MLPENLDILVVDDDDSIRSAIVIILKSEGYVVTEAANGEDAIALLKKHSYDLVLTDYELGETDGLAVVKEARATHPGCQVVLVTSFGSYDLAMKATSSWQDEKTSFMCKPFGSEDITEIAKKCLEKKIIEKKINFHPYSKDTGK